jgi:poly(hydroxyalkanoate) granule-associated protein
LKKPVGDAKKTVEDAVSDVRGRAGKTWTKVEHAFDQQVTMALHRLGVPTRKEITDLTRRVETLTRKLEGAPVTAKKPAARKKTAKKKKVASTETT